MGLILSLCNFEQDSESSRLLETKKTKNRKKK